MRGAGHPTSSLGQPRSRVVQSGALQPRGPPARAAAGPAGQAGGWAQPDGGLGAAPRGRAPGGGNCLRGKTGQPRSWRRPARPSQPSRPRPGPEPGPARAAGPWGQRELGLGFGLLGGCPGHCGFCAFSLRLHPTHTAAAALRPFVPHRVVTPLSSCRDGGGRGSASPLATAPPAPSGLPAFVRLLQPQPPPPRARVGARGGSRVGLAVTACG